ncbi:hypothetical protein ABIE65_001221 [Constrictibacter sp. MBR-5]|jgi:hypothetical protein|uniref:DUF6152 family protein n=1 Tax=Constrictibacter sp. MBR-5 TaxID=3156467 RepID=UPI00339AC01C
MRLAFSTTLAATAALGTVFAAPTPAAAHHGWSNYDSGKAMTVTAPVVESDYGHPHGSLTIESDGARWLVILAPPSRMTNRGLTPDAIAPGETVTVEGYPARNGDKEMRAERITAGGKTVEIR